MSYSYGSPEQGIARPRCWGDERYFNPNSQECRRCSTQGTCRDELLRLRNYQATQPVYQQPYQPQYQPQYQPAGYYPGYQVPPPPPPTGQMPIVSPPAMAQPTRQVTPFHPPQQPQQPQAIQMFPKPERYQYGWLSDPLYPQMFASPPPMIPQLPGETFLERLGKNMLRDAGVSMAANLYWALRQMVLPPNEPVNVTPPPPQQPTV